MVCKTAAAGERGRPSYRASRITSFVVQVLLGLVILACVAECVTLALRRYVPAVDERPHLHVLTAHVRNSQTDAENEHVPERPALRLSGDEKRLLAVSAEESVFSPGVDKKQRSYRNGTWTPRLAGARKEFEAYASEESSDDELSRPVM